MATKIDGQAIGKYIALGAGAVAASVLIGNAAFVKPLMTNAIMAWGIGGVTVGAVALAGLGVLAIDQLLFNK